MNLQQTYIPASNQSQDSLTSYSNDFLSLNTKTHGYENSTLPQGTVMLPVKAPSFKQFSDLYTGIQSIALENSNVMNSQIPPDLLDVVREMTTLLIHRYRSPLTGIMGFIDLMKINSGNVSAHYMETITSGLNEMSGLLDEMEELSRDQSANQIPTTIMTLLKNILDEYPKHEQSRIHIFDYSENQTVLADPVLSKTIFSVLLDNALEHDQLSQTDVIIEVNNDGRIIFTNFGTPIPTDFTLKMFYPFYSTKSRNMGLGLTKASIAAQAQGWLIELTSNSEVDGISIEIRSDNPKNES